MKLYNLVIVFLIFGVLTHSCNESDTLSTSRQYGVFRVLEDDNTVEMNGVIGSTSLKDFNDLEGTYPNINKINILRCEGSSDDEINLKLSAKIHQKGINIHLEDNGEIASGGVDFFLAGIKRTRGTNTKIGIHSWAGDHVVATDFPVGHANHMPYINYYVSVGFTQQQAEDFYYFTINAAPATAIHWMTTDEILKYNLLTE